MHPEETSDKPGRCSKCGMNLVAKKLSNNYTPLFIIIGLIFVTALTIASINNGFSVAKLLQYFMTGFFLVFAGFKLMDLKGFAEGYSMYDLLAKRIFAYGYVYPFIELFFGLAMAADFRTILVLKLEILVMTFSGIGVLIKVLKKEKFQCACLGTFLKVPLTNITLIEDFGMAALGLILLFLLK